MHDLALDASSSFKCDECPCSFRRIGSLNAHISRWHTKSVNEPEASGNKEPEDLLSKVIMTTGISSESLPHNKDDSNMTDLKTVVLAEKDKEGNIR